MSGHRRKSSTAASSVLRIITFLKTAGRHKPTLYLLSHQTSKVRWFDFFQGCALPATYAQSPDVLVHLLISCIQMPSCAVAAVKRRLLGSITSLIKPSTVLSIRSSDVPPENAIHRKSQFLEFVNVHFYADDDYGSAIISPSRTLSPIHAMTKTMVLMLFKFRYRRDLGAVLHNHCSTDFCTRR